MAGCWEVSVRYHCIQWRYCVSENQSQLFRGLIAPFHIVVFFFFRFPVVSNKEQVSAAACSPGEKKRCAQRLFSERSAFLWSCFEHVKLKITERHRLFFGKEVYIRSVGTVPAYPALYQMESPFVAEDCLYTKCCWWMLYIHHPMHCTMVISCVVNPLLL